MENDLLTFLEQQAFGNIDDINKNDLTLDLQGWISPNFHSKFTEIIVNSYNELQRPLMIIEIGSWKGLSACTMASIAKQNNIPCTIICIDTWLGSPDYWTTGINDINRGGSLNFNKGYPQIYYTFLNNVILENHTDIIRPLAISSSEAVDILNYYDIKPDIVYIDGAQEYSSVHNDICKYWKILHNNGYIFGSNYCDQCDGIKMAVNDFSRGVMTDKTIDDILWIIQKPINYL
jgi:hypothetical protein